MITPEENETRLAQEQYAKALALDIEIEALTVERDQFISFGDNHKSQAVKYRSWKMSWNENELQWEGKNCSCRAVEEELRQKYVDLQDARRREYRKCVDERNAK